MGIEIQVISELILAFGGFFSWFREKCSMKLLLKDVFSFLSEL